MNEAITAETSILRSVAKLVGGEENGEWFDTDLIFAINSALAVLTQLGVGPEEGFAISDDSASWYDFVGNDPRLNMIYTYVWLKTQMIFDPPSSNVAKEAKDALLAEMEWRSFATADADRT